MQIYRPTSRRRRRPLATRTRSEGPGEERRGVALIMVMILTTVMSAIAADLANASRVNLRAATNARDQLQAYFHARSAVELELYMLRFQGQVKSVLENFIPIPLFELSGFLVSSDTMKGIVDRKEKPEDQRKKDSFAINRPFGDFEGSFWIEEVVDENRKVNINLESPALCSNFMHTLLGAVIDDPKYDPLFESIGESHDPLRNRLEILANITDWVDANDSVDTVCTITGDQSQSSVSEDTRYDHLPYNARYKPKNGQMSSLAELRLVPGVNDAFMRLFSKYLTVWSDKKGISMKTADPWMLRAVVRSVMTAPPQPADEEKFQRFLQELELMRALPPPLNQMKKESFEQILDTAQIAYDKARLNDLVSKEVLRFDDISSVYRVTAMGRVNDASATITVVWRDDRAAGETFYWREE